MHAVYPLDKTRFFFCLVIDWIVIYRVEMSSYPTGHEQMGPFESVPDWTEITFNVSSKWKLLFGKAKTLIQCLRKRFCLLKLSILIVGGALCDETKRLRERLLALTFAWELRIQEFYLSNCYKLLDNLRKKMKTTKLFYDKQVIIIQWHRVGKLKFKKRSLKRHFNLKGNLVNKF